MTGEHAARRTAGLYDTAVPDWPGELDFYLDLAAKAAGQPILEVACGTGRVALRLAEQDMRVVGLDVSAEMLDVARRKSSGLSSPRWVQADMRTFDLGEQFGLVIIPGHSFQFMLTPADQLACLENIRRHLLTGGRLVVHLDHQDLAWLGGLCRDQGGVYEPSGELTDPHTGNRVRVRRAWQYERATQTATASAIYEMLDQNDQLVESWETGPTALHCVYRFEMQHLLERAGFVVEALYGDFGGGALADDSSEMIWVARLEP